MRTMSTLLMAIVSVLCLLPGCAAAEPQATPPPGSPTAGGATEPAPPLRLPPPPPSAPRPTQAPVSPSSAEPAATRATPPVPSAEVLEFHVQFDNRGDRPNTAGLTESLRLPQGLPIYRDRVEIVYEWRPADGKEDQINPRTGKPWGPIWKDSIAEMMEDDNLIRHLNTMGPWLDAWVPKDFTGVVCLDIERFEFKTDAFHFKQAIKDEITRKHPGKDNRKLLKEFVRRTQDRAKSLRPRVSGWGWWGLGGMHPAFPMWRKADHEKWIREEAGEDAKVLEIVAIPMPVFYFPTGLGDQESRSKMWDNVRDNWVRQYGRDRLARDGYAYLSPQHVNSKEGQILTAAEFRECYDAARALGMRRFVVWASIDSRQTRDDLQRFIDQTLTPLAREVAVREPFPKATPSPKRDSATGSPAAPAPVPAPRTVP